MYRLQCPSKFPPCSLVFSHLLLLLVLKIQPLNTPLVNPSPVRRDNALWLIVLSRASVIAQDPSREARTTTADGIGELNAGNRHREQVGVYGRGHNLSGPGREEGDAVAEGCCMCCKGRRVR